MSFRALAKPRLFQIAAQNRLLAKSRILAWGTGSLRKCRGVVPQELGWRPGVLGFSNELAYGVQDDRQLHPGRHALLR